MNKNVIAVVSIIATAFIVVFYIWSSHNRYYIMTSSKGIAYEVDKKTGESWMLHGGKKVPQESPERNKKQEEKELPFEESTKITGNASLSYGYFSGKIYNGSSWTVTKIVFNVTLKEEDGKIRWSHDFSDNVTVAPLTTEKFIISVTGGDGKFENIAWSIKQVFGYRE